MPDTLLTRTSGTRDISRYKLWEEDEPNNDVLRSHIYQPRNQLDKPFLYQMLITVLKVGFRLSHQIDFKCSLVPKPRRPLRQFSLELMAVIVSAFVYVVFAAQHSTYQKIRLAKGVS